MTWTWYEVQYLALSPLHIGWHTFGLVQRTRTYIPGRALWGALVNCLALAGSGGAAPPDYEAASAWIEEHVRFSYFFPGLEDDVLLPWFDPASSGLGFGYRPENSPVLSAGQFESCFIQVQGQTAVSPGANTAAEGTLHETEFLACEVVSPLSDRRHRVRYQGYLGLKNGAATPPSQLWSAWSEIRVGGERSSVCGRLRLAQQPRQLSTGETFFSLPVVPCSAPEAVAWPKGVPLPAHVAISNLEAAGDLEPLVGRLTPPTPDSPGFGQAISTAKKCWAPGSVLLRDGCTFTIDHLGVWSVNGA